MNMFLRVSLASACLSGVSSQWAKGFMGSLVDDTDAATMEQLVAEGGGIKAQSCGSPDDAMLVEDIRVQPNSLVVIVKGVMARQLTGGTVHAKLHIDTPDNLTFAQRLQHAAARSFAKGRVLSQPLCKHTGLSRDNGTCVIPAGRQELRLSFPRLPEMVLAGKYALHLRAVDENAQPVACIHGTLNVQPGKAQGLLRKLEGCSIEQWRWSFEKVYVSNLCDQSEHRWDLNFVMKPDADFHMVGHWHGFCDGEDENTLSLFKRVHGLHQECDPGASDPCGQLACSSKQCVWCEDCLIKRYQCDPTGHDTDCQSSYTFHVTPGEVEAMGQDLIGLCSSFAWRSLVPVTVAVPMLLAAAFTMP